jgi:hypothetical protein
MVTVVPATILAIAFAVDSSMHNKVPHNENLFIHTAKKFGKTFFSEPKTALAQNEEDLRDAAEKITKSK